MNSPTQKRIEIENHYIPKIKSALDKVDDAKDIYESDKLNRDLLVAIKTKQLIAQPVETYGFRIRQITSPAMITPVVQSMMEQGFTVYEMKEGFIKFIQTPKSTKHNPLNEIEKAAKSDAEKFFDAGITEKANKINKAIHAHNVLVKQAEEALSGIKPLESYLSVMVADGVSND